MKPLVRTGIVTVAGTVALGTAGFALAGATAKDADPVVKREDTSSSWIQSTSADDDLDDALDRDDSLTHHTADSANTRDTAPTANTFNTTNTANTKNTTNTADTRGTTPTGNTVKTVSSAPTRNTAPTGPTSDSR